MVCTIFCKHIYLSQPLFSVVFMKQNQNARQNRQGRSGQYNKPNQNNNQKRGGKGRHNNNRQQQQPASPTRQVDSRGPGGSLRGNAKQLYEKYKTLAQEKRSSDRQLSESLYQYADHYYRIFAEFAAIEAANLVAKENERAKRAQEEAERRENTRPPEPDEPIIQASEDEKPPKEKPKEKIEEKTEENIVEPAAMENPPPKKRRGRPEKAKDETAEA
ncbi:hypothetical protein MNBD_ALPHA01-604 [hydrothermal vent metagenome]|uniref:DUF4167 domain-containing protein n=1 Tax=hydrothermal vent metagenome TaxID=652676 RepID=A0A3B0SBT8_9ZZZZ